LSMPRKSDTEKIARLGGGEGASYEKTVVIYWKPEGKGQRRILTDREKKKNRYSGKWGRKKREGLRFMIELEKLFNLLRREKRNNERRKGRKAYSVQSGSKKKRDVVMQLPRRVEKERRGVSHSKGEKKARRSEKKQ